MQTPQAISSQHRDFVEQVVHFQSGDLHWQVHPLADLPALRQLLERPDDFLKEPK